MDLIRPLMLQIMQMNLSKKFNSEIILLSIVPSKIHHGDSSGVFGMVSQSYFN